MELAANLWAIVDSQSQLILRFAVRAYAMDAPDSVIASTLKSLANTDFVLARQFPVPKCFTLQTEHGPLRGAVTVPDFNVMQATITEDALKALETESPVLQGVGVDATGKPFHRRIPMRFPAEPYFVVTFLIEDTAGNLNIYTKA